MILPLLRWEIIAGMLLVMLLIGAAFIVSLSRMVRQRTAELQSIFDHMQEVLYRADYSGRILMVSPSVQALSGYSPKEIRGRLVTDFYADETERAELRKQLDHFGKIFDYRIRMRHKNGNVLWISVNSHVYHDSEGKIAGVEGTFRDVTALAQTEEKLQTLVLAVENSPASIIVTDSEGCMLHVNPAYERISGYTSKEVLGKNPRFQGSGQTPVEAYRDMWTSVTAGKTWRGEFMNRRKNGELYCQSAAIAPVRDSHGEIRFYVAVQEDISERKRIAEELEKARMQADAANAAKSRFLAAASHDLRQPLQAMRLYLDVLAERTQAVPEQRIIGKLQAASDDVGNMLDRLLNISQLDAAELKAEPEVFDLSAMLHDLHEQYAAQCEDAGLGWRLHMPAGILRVESDPVFVKEILINLISNAIRYTRHGGILLAARRRGEKLRLEVWDTGPGIDKDRQDEVFHEFVQLGNPERDRRNGVGLGLAIASRMSRLLGGQIELRSRPGRGSVFCFGIPLISGDVPLPARPVVASGGRDFQGMRVFVIDDDPQMLDSLGLMLEQWHCEVMCFGDQQEAIAALEDGKHMPDAVIADFRLRDNATGVEAIRALHALAGHAIPALLLTGDTEPSRMQEATSAGFPLLHKPVAANKLGLFLERHLLAAGDRIRG
ncbi:MAG: hypothetical protein COS82_04655 [Zetaproteobacteria bacterium CG06_land_8_20_14_3_00_59_53]|nr:MAG: hypothetical protein AUK36_08120 [Zetaproteobacteria bacterium CG2_30_59_37]PIO88912.1 MAG: hypothetical protein COX56_10760 [Zetaproteobacteria bacterium CG23_combo_of_CG06-09_8_20_14_all_59_86]PIQ65215.1 MAG: hypothetical protein COV97_05340 [Zetaproteobacteria bacterium CG11_big_fil_rev_8_21_14_0_20_59_439]PIU70793.1 MAG: hypothetical protein COS82_04655 [Zetaproteobacteria bacterium CG06_land_8_20_14_3_00_59_53]PIU96465.1 MAG: hypothetical protein COS62_08990 [Zetaproteobacteria bac